MPHVLEAQVGVEFGRVGHTLPHAPQFVTLVRRSVSQPLPARPSQLPKPALQLNPQAPAAHVRVALATVGQTLPHAPQLFTSASVRISQPSLEARLQSA